MPGSDSQSRGELLVVSERAEDNALGEMLQRRKYAVRFASPERFDLALLDDIDLLLISVATPDSPGVPLCRKVKHVRPDDFLPVVVLVDTTGVRSRVESLVDKVAAASEADAVLPRSTSAAILARRIASFVGVRRRLIELESENRQLRDTLESREQAYNQLMLESRQVSILRDSIINNVSHELRTPMLQVKSAVHMLDSEIRANPALQSMERMLEYAAQATTRLESVIQNISQLASSFSLKNEPFRLIDAANLALRQLGRSWSSSPEVPRVRVDLGKVAIVTGDKNAVAQVLSELIANGLKFSPDGTPVDVRARRVRDGIEVSVQDYGIGVDRDHMEAIFQPFYQVEHESTRRFPGTGTGLAIVKLILDGMGVPISVQSERDKGSIFSFVLPLADLR
ncbi:MAG: HAMP domain-containing histidine kinase [Anaerolineae bacterium]|nr:HAMP domain-containing histidine kinase [Anaerolineae bacterium]